jgi:GNAT superfamily N-acetyltransferase
MTGYDRPEILRLRAMTVEDIPAGLRLCRAAEWNQLDADWRVFLSLAGAGAFLVERGERVLGTVAFLRYGSFGWIAMMLVDPEERRAGIGTQLMQAVMSELSDARCVALDATPLGEPLYRRFGLTAGYDLVRTKAKIDATRFRTASRRVRRMTGDDLADVLACDRKAFGADRGQLLSSLFDRAPECAWIVREGLSVDGYTFGRPGRLYSQLGPIVAGDRDIARELVAQCLAEFDGELFAIDAPRLDAEWLAWLRSAGFEEERPFVRMFRAGDTQPGVPELQYAIAGPEFA